MRRLPLHRSLFLWFLALTLFLWVGSGAALYLHQRSAWRAALDLELEARAEGLLALCELEDDGQIEFEYSQERVDEMAAESPERSFEIWTWPEARLLRRSGPVLGPLPREWRSSEKDRWTFATADRRGLARIGVLAPESHEDDEPTPSMGAHPPRVLVLVRVADSLRPVERRLDALLRTLLGLGSIAGLLLLAFGTFLSRRVARPLRNLAHAAEELRSGARVVEWPRARRGDELDRLAEMLDEAFSSMRSTLERQKRFVANAAHELRNPLASLSAIAEIATRRPRASAEYEAFFADVLTTARRLNEVVEGLLWLARAEEEEISTVRRDVDVTQAIENTLALLDPADRRRVRVRSTAQAPPHIPFHPLLLPVALRNLLDNALRHALPDSIVEIVLSQGAGVTSIHVLNEGEPPAPDDRERLFERFERGPGRETAKQGAGLGLAITRAIAERFGGTCRLCDHAPKRTCFVLTFPEPHPSA